MRVTFLLPHIGVAGGIRSTFELANRLQDRGLKVSVVYPLIPMRSGEKWYDIRNQARRAKGTIVRLKHRNRVGWFDLKANLIGVPTLAERYVPKGDIVVATWWETAYYVNSYNKNRGEKFYFLRAYEIWGGPEDLVHKTYTFALHKIVTSTWLKTLIEGKFNVTTLGPVPNGVNFDLFYRERDDFECHNPKRIGMVYKRLELKGMADGFEAFRMAKEKHPGIQLVLFGGPKGEDVPEDVELHEFPSPKKLRELYNSLDIFVYPSREEGFGNPPMEAMACGAACIATDVGAVPDYIIDGRTGLICPPHAPDKLAECLASLLEDEGKRKQIAKAGYEHIQQFTWDKSVAQLEVIFDQVLERQGRGGS